MMAKKPLEFAIQSGTIEETLVAVLEAKVVQQRLFWFFVDPIFLETELSFLKQFSGLPAPVYQGKVLTFHRLGS